MSGRIFSSIGFEHIILKGNNALPVFLDSEDKKYFLNLFMSKKKDSTIFISYCLMSNHIHLVIKEDNPEEISKLIENTLKPYVSWFNQKYNRNNSLFKKRFYNEPIEDEIQLLNTIKYVHKNPVAAGMVSTVEQYPWSSYKEYKGIIAKNRIDLEYVSNIISLDQVLAENKKFFEDDSKNEKYTDSYEYVANLVKDFFDSLGIDCSIYDIKKMNNEYQIKLLKYLYETKRCKRKTIAKVTGMSENYIYKLLLKEI